MVQPCWDIDSSGLSEDMLFHIFNIFAQATGRRFRALTIVDDYTRECPAIEVDTSLGWT